MKSLRIDLGEASYPVFIGRNVFDDLDEIFRKSAISGPYFVLCDEHVFEKFRIEKYFDGVTGDSNFFLIPAKKNNKTFYYALKIFEEMERLNVPRNSTLIAIGGGVVGDVGAFIAACWYRGISLIHIPTTLLAAVDSCLGGKAALNFRSTVNAVGLYYHPALILVDTAFIAQLPRREISSGFGEILKYSMLKNSELDTFLDDSADDWLLRIDEIIASCLSQKAEFVNGDVREASKRLFLNFGHTIGHAIEFSTIIDGEEYFRHGEGVALGMIAIFKVGEVLGYTRPDELRDLKIRLSSFGLPTSVDSRVFGLTAEQLRDRVLRLVYKDKKRVGAELRLILIEGKGSPFIYKTNDSELIKAGIEEVVV